MYYNILLLRGSRGSESEFLWAILPLGYVPLKIGLTQSKRRMRKTQTDLGPGKRPDRTPKPLYVQVMDLAQVERTQSRLGKVVSLPENAR